MKWLKSKTLIHDNPVTYPYGDVTRQRSTDDVRPKTDTDPTSEGEVGCPHDTRLPGPGLVDETIDPVYKRYLGRPNTDYTSERGVSVSKEEI